MRSVKPVGRAMFNSVTLRAADPGRIASTTDAATTHPPARSPTRVPATSGDATGNAPHPGGGGRSRMIPAPFDYVRPPDLDGALRILEDREGEAKILSGGYSLLPLLKLRLAQPALLVDLRDVAGLDGITETDDELRIGARATHRRIKENEVISGRYPSVADVAGGIGDPQVRNW